jgi:hypothetical protein
MPSTIPEVEKKSEEQKVSGKKETIITLILAIAIIAACIGIIFYYSYQPYIQPAIPELTGIGEPIYTNTTDNKISPTLTPSGTATPTAIPTPTLAVINDPKASQYEHYSSKWVEFDIRKGGQVEVSEAKDWLTDNKDIVVTGFYEVKIKTDLYDINIGFFQGDWDQIKYDEADPLVISYWAMGSDSPIVTNLAKKPVIYSLNNGTKAIFIEQEIPEHYGMPQQLMISLNKPSYGKYEFMDSWIGTIWDESYTPMVKFLPFSAYCDCDPGTENHYYYQLFFTPKYKVNKALADIMVADLNKLIESYHIKL